MDCLVWKHLTKPGSTAGLFISAVLGTTDSKHLNIFFPACLHSVQFSHSVMSDSLQPHESQHARPACPSPSPRVHSDSRPLSQWCHPAISSSVVPFSSCPQSLPASEFFPMSQLFAWGGQSTGASALASFLPKKSQIAVKRREAKSQGENERYKHLNAEFQRIARRDKKAFFSDQCKEIEENNRMGKTRKKIRDTKGTFHAKVGSIKDRNGTRPNRSRRY